MGKERLDVLLVKRNLVETREKAKRIIMAGLVFSESERMDKPGVKIEETRPLTVKGTIPYVGRGGFKLEKALDVFDVSVKNKHIVDIGSSTGGFTDCALQKGAAYIYAIDVGYNQLAWKLRNDPRVAVHERTNFRYVTKALFSEGLPHFAMTDVSFISLRLIFPVLKMILQPNSDIIALIKPQFEAEKALVGKKGVIRDPIIHRDVLTHVITAISEEGFTFTNLDFSPITGGEGNIEFLSHFIWGANERQQADLSIIQRTVEAAHHQFGK
jgi:23S rRNA (cytidine1920-2'-O)/16S rRNA (cytidine1409-2'-O)-methyltransferase